MMSMHVHTASTGSLYMQSLKFMDWQWWNGMVDSLIQEVRGKGPQRILAPKLATCSVCQYTVKKKKKSGHVHTIIVQYGCMHGTAVSWGHAV